MNIDAEIRKAWEELLELIAELEDRFLYLNFLLTLRKHSGGGKKWKPKKKEKLKKNVRLTFGLN